ncbi:type VI secretion system protein ImpE [Andreprevotia lacus DSM 23236]|jgi:type VI secretion system protein ImpE|uniref:Type VI secretion system protein ImpE n=1 Tax=Andreprevotia lacus DSM 23236 TaxID=1121001 RepID=A0A1W1XM15_9NEIS|nr:type VI secretion system accessory protein TagJ [Andreprevotia lacus]SMC24983.1 type VI secretion system protein ImpE [Andreprevotia lacus DSM 23236]
MTTLSTPQANIDALIKQGQLDEALQHIQDVVRNAPSHAPHRVVLIQLLLVLGQWDRAEKQLQQLELVDREYTRFCQTYLAALRGERQRLAVFKGEAAPQLPETPPAWMVTYINAMLMERTKAHSAAVAERQRAAEAAPTVAGEIDGVPFDWLADADPRLGPVVEAIIDGHYHWLAQDEIRQIDFFPPQTLLDHVWRQATIITASGQNRPALIPARYPESPEAGAPLALARATEWIAVGSDGWQGMGQRLLTSDENEYGLLDIRLLCFAAGHPASA